MLHEPAATTGKDPAAPFKARAGIWMFAFYALIYVGFVALNLASPLSMEATVFLGLNLATVFGFGLIVVALVQALVYDALCNRRERALAEPTDGEEA